MFISNGVEAEGLYASKGDMGSLPFYVRSEELQNESFPISFEFLARIVPQFLEEFSCFISGNTETRKNSPKTSPVINAKFPG